MDAAVRVVCCPARREAGVTIVSGYTHVVCMDAQHRVRGLKTLGTIDAAPSFHTPLLLQRKKGRTPLIEEG